MAADFFNDKRQKRRVLVVPLDWGLGHATRCIPIIKHLIAAGVEVIVGADKSVHSLLKKEFPDLVFLRCKGYEIAYSYQKRYFFLKLISQSFKILLSIRNEKRWLKRIIADHKIDAVIADNRFGMHHKKIPSVYITHQLSIKTGNAFTDSIAQKIHYYFIKKFNYCWVPDESMNGLAGELSHPKKIPQHTFYIGPLSRFIPLLPPENFYDVLIMISGPEPQRTIFENEILQQLNTFGGTAFFIRGLPSTHDEITHPNQSVTIVNHLSAHELNKRIEQSKMIIARSGYTTVMDLATLNKNAILVPTPRQTEQEYLAEYLHSKGYFFSVTQQNFSLKESLINAGRFSFNSPHINFEAYKKTIDEFVLSLKTSKFASQ